MSQNESRRTGILRLRHLQEVTEARGEEMAEQAPRFERLADPAAKPRVVSAFNLFQSPEPLAARLAGMFTAFGRTLEPSAGLGRLYRAVRAVSPECPVTLVDQSPECCGELYRAIEGDGNVRLVAGDFLTMDAERLGLFDSIIMNPPFRLGADCKHVLHARTLLAPNGRLVSLVANGPRQRAALKPIAAEWHDLPANSFKGEGTAVSAAIVVFENPE
jgi:hypothetical protein